MLTHAKVAFLIGALVAGTAFANTGPTVPAVDQSIARERNEGPRGGDPDAIQVRDSQLARERNEGPRGGDPDAIQVVDQLA